MTSINTPAIFAAVVLAGLVTLAAPAQAMFVDTPLLLEPDQAECDVGDTLTFAISARPDNASHQQDWAGKTVDVRYSFDKNEGQQGSADDPVSNDGYVEELIRSITLDSKASGSFTWTVPAEADDRNVHVFLQAGDEHLASAYIAVGNATPMMHAMSGPAGEQPEIDTEDRDVEAQDAPGLGILALVGAVAAVAVLRRR